jgi:hypothetical protein
LGAIRLALHRRQEDLMLFQNLLAGAQALPRRSPMTSDELYAVRWAAGAVTRAARAGDVEGRAALFADLQSVLADVRQRRGDHPVLWELEADFTPEPDEAADLYLRAEQAASDAGLPTLSIRLSLARLLLKELACPVEARDALLACRKELPDASEKQSAAWARLLADCERTLDSFTP